MVLFSASSILAAADQVITAEDIYGRWVLVEKVATKEQATEVAAAKLVEGFGVVLTAR